MPHVAAEPRPCFVIARRLQNLWLRTTSGFRPEVVLFDLTHACNSQCQGCGYRDALPGELPSQRWVELAHEAAELGFSDALLTGGEPLLHPGFDEIVRGVGRSLAVSVHTNGMLLGKKAEVLRGCAMLYVSLDALDDDVHRRVRGVPVGPVLSGLDGVLAPVHLRVTVWRDNLSQLLPIADFARERGFKVSYLAADTSGTAFGQLEPDAAGPGAEEVRQALAPLYSHPAFAGTAASLERITALARGGTASPRCNAPWTSGVVGPTGDWRPCFFLPAEAHTRHGLGAAIAGSPRRVDVRRNPVCQRCVCWR